jgi:Xaa-Pro aminopeptidase
MIKNRIKKLKELMSAYKIDGYIIPKNDAYFSEFALPDRLKTITNLSSSAGFAVITKNKNFLFVDGRYTIQAENQAGKLFKIVEIPKNLPSNIFRKYKKKLLLGFDPQLFTNKSLKNNFSKSCNFLPIKKNLIDIIEKGSIRESVNSFYSLSKKITGESVASKISRLIKKMNSKKIQNIFVSAPENVAWLLNLRGKDNPFSPVPNCKIILTEKKKVFFFSCPKKIKLLLKNKPLNNFKFCKYEDFTKIINDLSGKNFCLDGSSCSVANENIIKKKFKIKSYSDPCYIMKSIKNSVEIKQMIDAHVKDGIALTKFIFWLKKLNKKEITEIDAQNKLEKFRKLNNKYLFPSFNTIAGTGSNGAIVHYRATKDTNKKIKKRDIFLCDSGGQYKYGTTDVTRTICFSDQKNSIKDIFTKVLKGHIAVATSDIKKFYNGKKIDQRARYFLKKDGLDYAHGTGHGVGFFLNVHEGPQSISKYNTIKFKEGMILSNEPGFYKKNKFGIRIENLVYIKKNKNNLFFENLTLAPIEKDLINYKLLNKNEKDYLFRYHLNVYASLSKFLNEKEKKWLASLL